MKKVLLTQDALTKLEQELEELIAKRILISAEIKKARAFGDLSENAEYHAARESQSFNETEIIKVKALLENYEIADTTNVVEGSITLNSEVEIKFLEDDLTETIKLVSKIEADPINSLISNESPIGGSILGHFAGDIVECQTPSGQIKIVILSVNNK